MASFAVWVGNVRASNNVNSARSTANGVVELDEGKQFITDAFPIYIKATGATNSDQGAATASATAAAYLLNDRATLTAASVTAAEVPVCTGEELKCDTPTMTVLAGKIDDVNTKVKMTNSTTGKYRWSYGKGVYALGYAWSDSDDAEYVQSIGNVVWK
tara:strand:+ start:1086 stop:1559 length:474 start_codon:yes stop_codon:yes gene_type:complete